MTRKFLWWISLILQTFSVVVFVLFVLTQVNGFLGLIFVALAFGWLLNVVTGVFNGRE
jgi:hypothetical protein